MKNVEGKQEPRKRWTTESEKREGEMTNKLEKDYFEPILNLFSINAIFLWNDHVLIIIN